LGKILLLRENLLLLLSLHLLRLNVLSLNLLNLSLHRSGLGIASLSNSLNESFLVFNHKLVDLDVALNGADVTVHLRDSSVGETRSLLSILKLRCHKRLLELLELLLLVLISLLTVILVLNLAMNLSAFPFLHFTESVNGSDRHNPAKEHEWVKDWVSPGGTSPFKVTVVHADTTDSSNCACHEELLQNNECH
jgi:hypothetical protein